MIQNTNMSATVTNCSANTVGLTWVTSCLQLSYFSRLLLNITIKFPSFFSQVYRGAVSGLPGNRVHRLGLVGEPCGSCCHDSHILYYRLSETQIHQKIYLTLFLFSSKKLKADNIHEMPVRQENFWRCNSYWLTANKPLCSLLNRCCLFKKKWKNTC